MPISPARSDSGAILQVVGESGRWADGQLPENDVWLATWVDFSRADNSSQPPPQTEASSQTQTSSPVDNCCYVTAVYDRPAMGRWLLGLSNGTVRHTDDITTDESCEAGETSAIDNCCYAGWQCNNDQDWINGYHAYKNNQCAATQTPRGGGDSCCAHGWNCTIESDWILGRSVYADYGGQCIVASGTSDCRRPDHRGVDKVLLPGERNS